MAPEKLAELWALDPNEPKGPREAYTNETCQICSVIFQLASLRLLLFLNMNPLTLQQRARKLSKAFHGILFLLIYLKLSIF
ncbi:hypothetical protein Peur_062578 [Populus x canadensis]